MTTISFWRIFRGAKAMVGLFGLTTAVALPWIVGAYTISLASYALVAATLAMSAQLLNGVTGLPSLGQAAYLGAGAYSAGLAAVTWHASGPVQLIIAVAVASACAAITGTIVVQTRRVSFMVATLAVGELANLAAEHMTSVTGGGNGLAVPPVLAWPGGPTLDRDDTVYLYVLGSFLVISGTLWLALRSRFGLVLRGIAGNEMRMRTTGYRVTRWLLAAYVLAAATAGAAGALLVTARRYVSPSDLAFDVSALALVAAILGGRTLAGAAVAAAGLIAIRDMTGNLLTGYSPVLLGVTFIAVALLRTKALPDGADAAWWRRS